MSTGRRRKRYYDKSADEWEKGTKSMSKEEIVISGRSIRVFIQFNDLLTAYARSPLERMSALFESDYEVHLKRIENDVKIFFSRESRRFRASVFDQRQIQRCRIHVHTQPFDMIRALPRSDFFPSFSIFSGACTKFCDLFRIHANKIYLVLHFLIRWHP